MRRGLVARTPRHRNGGWSGEGLEVARRSPKTCHGGGGGPRTRRLRKRQRMSRLPQRLRRSARDSSGCSSGASSSRSLCDPDVVVARREHPPGGEAAEQVGAPHAVASAAVASAAVAWAYRQMPLLGGKNGGR